VATGLPTTQNIGATLAESLFWGGKLLFYQNIVDKNLLLGHDSKLQDKLIKFWGSTQSISHVLSLLLY
jgi:hypothetical protein